MAGHVLRNADSELPEFEVALVPLEGQAAAAVRMLDPEGRSLDTHLVVALDSEVTPELEAEGTARDVIRQVQQARKDADLHVTDRISLRLAADSATVAALTTHDATLRAAVLAVDVTYEELAQGADLQIELEVAASRFGAR